MSSSIRLAVLFLALLTLHSCATAHRSAAGDSNCPRYQERIAAQCVPVSVTDIEAVPLSFERAGYTLEGTLLRPLTRGQYRSPAVLLIHGSGPNDRDESAEGSLGISFGQRIPIFRQLAEALVRQGLTVYRYDKRTCFRENSGNRCPHALKDYVGDPDRIMTADYILDARVALKVLSQQPGVDASDLTVIGHSEGANFVPLLMKDEPGVVAGVQLAGAADPIDKVVVDQLRDLAAFLERTDAQYAPTVAGLRAEAERYQKALQQIRGSTFAEPRFEGATVGQWQAWIQQTENLRAEFQAVTQPILLLNGDFDFNIGPRHLAQFQQWAAAAHMDNAHCVLLPGVTHAFVTLDAQKTGVDPNFSPLALKTLVDWHRALKVKR